MNYNIYLARHGETTANEQGVYIGIGLYVPLNKTGLRDARRLMKALHNVPLDVIISSDAIRAVQTAMPTAIDHGLPIHLECLIREMDQGTLVGKCYGPNIERSRRVLYEGKGLVENEVVEYKGEKIDGVYQRALKFIFKLIEDYKGKNILVVGHGIFLPVQCHALEDPKTELGYRPQYDPKFNLETGKYHHYIIGKNDQIQRVNLNMG